MLTPAAIDSLTGTTVYDSAGYLIGHVASVYLDERSGQPTFITITTEDAPEQIAPFRGATLADSQIRLAYPRADIGRAPHMPDVEQLAAADFLRLDAHYGLTGPGPESGAATR